MSALACTYSYPDRLPCGQCHEGCPFKDPETTPEALCGTSGYVPCGDCQTGCAHHERHVQIRAARTTGRWPDGALYANPSYVDPWAEDDFDWSTGQTYTANATALDDDGFDWATGEWIETGGSAQTDDTEIVFNAAQIEVIEHFEGPLLVVAGAGSGKTGAVTARMVRLVDRGVEPGAILSLTFTRKAAMEMRERVEMKMGHRATHLTISTFHSLACAILRDHPLPIRRQAGFSIWDDRMMIREMRRIIKATTEQHERLPTKQGKPPTSKELLEEIGKRKTNGKIVLDQDYLVWLDTNLHPNASEIITEYESLKEAANALDFDDLIWMAVRLLTNHEDVLEGYRERWEFVMCDEYQDTNDLQERFLALLVGPRCNLVAVGDEDQAIYGWRGSNVRHILTFTDRYPNGRVIELGQNYRSTSQILASAARVIAHNKERRNKRLWTDNQCEKFAVQYYKFTNPFHEAEWIAKLIGNSIEAGWVPEEHAVLVRTRRQFIALQHALSKLEIHYQTVGWIDLWERADVKLIMGWLRAAINPQDTASGAGIFAGWPRIGAKTVVDWREGISAGQNPSGIFDAMTFLLSAKGRGPKTKRGQSIQLFEATYRELLTRIRAGSDTVRDLVTWLYEVTGIDEEIRVGMEKYGLIAEEAHGRKALHDDFIGMCPGETITNGYDAVTAFLDTALANAHADKDEPAITLSTIHSAKGLEWDHVWVAGMVEGILPFSRTLTGGRADLDSAAKLEEERRLAYVAMTRARKRLYLTRYRKQNDEKDPETNESIGRSRMVKPSRFLIESRPPSSKKTTPTARLTVGSSRSPRGLVYDFSHKKEDTACP